MKGKRIPVVLLVILAIALPLLLLGIFQTQNSRSNAAAADKLETEDGVRAGNATLQSDSSASGGSFVTLGINQTTSPTPSQNSQIYGMGVAGDSLANTVLGGQYLTNVQFMRFRATQTSNLTAFRFYYLGPPDPGYADGTGGTWSVGVHEDDGSADHLPKNSPITTVTNVAPMGQSSAATGRLVTLTTPASLTAGKIYHLVFTNTDANPAANYFSPDYWYIYGVPDRKAGTAPYPTQIHPLLPNSDWGHGYKYNGEWFIREGYLPILDLTYANGAHQGWSYGEASYGGVDEIGEINGTTKMVRERIIVSGGNKTVTGAGIRILRTTGSSPVTIRLENSSGSLIDSITIPASSFATGPAPSFSSNPSWDDLGAKAKYVSGNFSTPRTLTNGQTYFLRISTASDTTYWAWVNRRLQDYGYTPATYFSDGVAQYTRDGTTWANLGRSKGDQDLQFYFTTTSSVSSPTPTTIACPANLQTAITNAATGSTLDVTGCGPYSGTFTISKAMTLKGAKINFPANNPGILITADNVTVTNAVVTGPQSTAMVLSEKCVAIRGTSTNVLDNVTVRDSTMSRCGYGGVYATFANTALITNNNISDSVYAGILLAGVTNSTVSNNTILRTGVYGTGPNFNAYGITATYETGTPKSSDVTIQGNTIDTVPMWHGLDTHAGVRIKFLNNIVRGARRAVFLTVDPIDITVSGNDLTAPTAAQISACQAIQDGRFPTYCSDIHGIQVVDGSGSITNNIGHNWPPGLGWWYPYSGGGSGYTFSGNNPSIP